MKSILKCFACLTAAVFLLSLQKPAIVHHAANELTGAWLTQSEDEERVILFIDGYYAETAYSVPGKAFRYTRGGPYKTTGNDLEVLWEFDTREKEQTGTSGKFIRMIRGKALTLRDGGQETNYQKVDDGTAPLSGVWSITSRMQDGALVPIHRTGTRKTVKILSGSRFQWAAIDPGQKQFSGTGGGTYEFVNGKYTEHIRFFSRDSSRVGASLSFDGKLEGGDWHHSGLSSRGDKIYEVWSRINK